MTYNKRHRSSDELVDDSKILFDRLESYLSELATAPANTAASQTSIERRLYDFLQEVHATILDYNQNIEDHIIEVNDLENDIDYLNQDCSEYRKDLEELQDHLREIQILSRPR